MEFLVQLKSELVADPQGLGYGPLVAAQDHAGVASMLNDRARGYTRVIETYVNARVLMSKLGAVSGAEILDALNAVSASISAVKWAMFFLTSSEGINLGDPQTRGMLAQLAAGGVLTAQQRDNLLALAQEPQSRVEILFGNGRTVTPADVEVALQTA